MDRRRQQRLGVRADGGSLAYSGFLATVKYMGVKMPSTPESTNESAAVCRKICTSTVPLGARCTNSMTTRASEQESEHDGERTT